ncbi:MULTISPECIES: hypothetical protein [unclassified Vibrio]|uniref:hypothetical protein n=1 Tax=unclassified Vibrio TaxID=2614977 RepID=UPI000B8E6DB4|nr:MULTISPECIES: hypothetical protein [unclassified Vibrio]NAW90980.1 hypothetical protein [Vibrio sp. V24_P1S3T111]OXX20031.1 hypothetical protein B9J88_15155 [Vibrio sp. V05_P4A8T149]OXX31284.1 hypothetical protein B9J95_09435 [Vibrio sp. V14_P6S14T42]OXX39111.1 hypothetical protein B9J81_00375 [Vibrio sp. V04_P4A5T148]OXX51621.1 hypothetical protein B9J91_16720 [Vibrio sp. V18_P1S4T112]
MDPIEIAIKNERRESFIEYNFIVWTDRQINKVIGVTFDKVKGEKVSNRALLQYLVNKISSKDVPIILIEHDFPHHDIQVINAHKNKLYKYQLLENELADLICSEFSIKLTNSEDKESIKTVNVNERVYDGFHTWSRQTFGSSIKKCDVDCLLFNDGQVMLTIEVKNTSRSGIEIENWQPYPDDQDNYKIIGLFSRDVLNCDFITLHHNLPMDTNDNSSNINVGLWRYDLSHSFSYFRSNKNRIVTKLSEVICEYTKI